MNINFKNVVVIALSVLFGFPCLAARPETKVVAHRGYWRTQGSAQNSIASFSKADSIGAFGSEMDVWYTSDGGLVVNHDKIFKGVNMPVATKAVATAVVLDNGENLPTLEQYLKTVAEHPATRLVLEQKELKDDKVRENEACSKIYDMLKEYGLAGRTDYISFSLNACKEFHKIAPSIPVYYLNGELSPKEIKELGFAGIDYSHGVLSKHPEWIDEAHKLGLKVNVWTVDDPEIMKHYLNAGVDFITTNEPVVLQKLIKDLK